MTTDIITLIILELLLIAVSVEIGYNLCDLRNYIKRGKDDEQRE